MVDSCTEVGGVPSDDGGGKQGEALGLEWSSPRWPDTSTKSAFDVREWTQRVGKESCWEGNDREESSPMSSNVDAVEIVRSSGKPIRQVANELGIYDSTLGNWVRQDETNRGEREGLTSGERERLRELERENARLRTERELEKTSCGVVGEGVERVMPYRFVDAEVAEGFPVRLVCSVVGVSPSAYYASKQPSLVLRSWPRMSMATPVWSCAAGRGCAGGRDPDDLAPVWGDLWFASGVRRAASAGPGGEPQAGGAVDEGPPYCWFRSPQAACHHHRGHRSSDP